jgi:hypothetical protein
MQLYMRSSHSGIIITQTRNVHRLTQNNAATNLIGYIMQARERKTKPNLMDEQSIVTCPQGRLGCKCSLQKFNTPLFRQVYHLIGK